MSMAVSIGMVGTAVEISIPHRETFQCVLSLVTGHDGCGFNYFNKIIMTMYATGFPPGMFEMGCPKVVGGLEKKSF